MKFLFHTVTLGQTGGARVILNLSEALVKKGHEVEIILDRKKIEYEIPVGVRVKHLSVFGLQSIENNQGSKFTSKIKSIEAKAKPKSKFLSYSFKWLKYFLKLLLTYPIKFLIVRKFLKGYQPNLVASHNMYQDFEHIFFYKNICNFYLVIHNSPNEVFKERQLFRLLPLALYFNNLNVIGVSNAAIDEMNELFGDKLNSSNTIYNSFDLDLIRKKAEVQIDSDYVKDNYFVCVASLSPRKRVDRLIKAISFLDIDVKLILLGGGPEQNNLQNLCKALGVSDRVVFGGFVQNPYPIIKNSLGLYLSSDSEGLPTVLIESLILGVPVVSLDCPTGPKEILIGELEKYLIELNEEEVMVSDLSKSMRTLASDPPEIDKSSVIKFDQANIVKKWEVLAFDSQLF